LYIILTNIIILALSIVFFNSSHPIILIAVILSQSLLICLLIWIKIKIRWFSFILFLIFLGGLMVLFIYISRLASNEKFYIKFNTFTNSLAVSFSLTLIFIIFNFNTSNLKSEWINIDSLFKEIYSISIFSPTLITIIYLLLTLIVVVKVRSKYEGPLRNIIFK